MDKIGVVIPCHNNLNVLKKSIPSFYNDRFFIVVYDDKSSDGTSNWLSENYPKIYQIKGDGKSWWTGSLKNGIDFCLKNNCNYILSLNADVLIDQETIINLLNCSKKKNNSVIASLVVSYSNLNNIIWAGSIFDKISPWIPIFVSKYLHKNMDYSDLKKEVYEVDEVHGRGVIIPSEIFKTVGNYDNNVFPHYGGDTDFSLKLKKNGIKMFVQPNCVVKLFENNTGLSRKRDMSFKNKISQIIKYLFKTKNGDGLRVWFRLYSRHLKFYYFFQSYFFVIFLNIYRRLK